MEGAIQDITERKQAEEAPRASEERLRHYFDLGPGLAITSPAKGWLEVNDETCRILGYERGELLQTDWAKLTHPDDLELDLSRFGRVLAGEFDGYSIEKRFIRKDGHIVPASVSVWGVRRADGQVDYFVAVIQDVTEQRKAEEHRRQLESQLLQSQKLEAVGRLAGGVAHDFNNILGVITGYGELMQRQLDQEHPVRPRLDQILKAAERAAGLTRQLLAFSRKQVIQPRILDLNTVVADLDKMLRRLIGEDVELQLRQGEGLGAVKVDLTQLEQVVLNLAVNARDAMPQGGHLTIETANADLDEAYATGHPPTQPGRYVMLSVSDSGIGMDAETLRQVFEPFFTTKPAGEGSGLGLATVYGVVKQSGGYIWAYSEPGRGATFKIYLPRVDEEPEELAAQATATTPPRGHETVLVVEDTDTLREVIREMLDEQGYTLLHASHGEEALAIARAHSGPIHLLLTDLVMPRLGGAELASALASLRPEMRVVYMSGYTDRASSRQGVLPQGTVVLEKPFTCERLARAVRVALDAPRSQSWRGTRV